MQASHICINRTSLYFIFFQCLQIALLSKRLHFRAVLHFMQGQPQISHWASQNLQLTLILLLLPGLRTHLQDWPNRFLVWPTILESLDDTISAYTAVLILGAEPGACTYVFIGVLHAPTRIAFCLAERCWPDLALRPILGSDTSPPHPHLSSVPAVSRKDLKTGPLSRTGTTILCSLIALSSSASFPLPLPWPPPSCLLLPPVSSFFYPTPFL